MANEMYPNNADVQQAVTAALDEQKRKKKKKKLIIIAVIAVIIVIGAVLGSGGGENAVQTESKTDSQQISEATKAEDGKLGDYVCTIKSATKCKNWEGKDAVKIVYSFTNNSSNPSSFDVALTDRVFQDGIALETTFNSSDEDQIWDVEIKPGITKDVTKVYKLRNSTSDLEIEVGEWISFDNTKYTTTIKF